MQVIAFDAFIFKIDQAFVSADTVRFVDDHFARHQVAEQINADAGLMTAAGCTFTAEDVLCTDDQQSGGRPDKPTRQTAVDHRAIQTMLAQQVMQATLAGL